MARRKRPAAYMVTAHETGTDPCDVDGQFQISIVASTAPAWDGTITLQRTFDGTAWLDVESWTDVGIELTAEDKVGASYRLYCANGDYTAGTALLTLRAE